MGKKSIFVSDLSGEEIADGKGAQVTIRFNDARKGTIVLDVTDSEAEQMGKRGRKQARRGRRPKSVSEVPSGSKPIEAVGTRDRRVVSGLCRVATGRARGGRTAVGSCRGRDSR
jgi:hypothetical protein